MILVGIALGAYAWRDFQQVAILVEWSTASELSTVGFNIYRSTTKEGEYKKVNQTLIPASTDPLGGGDYSYRDTTVAAGATYFYQLEDVDSSGASERYGPIQVVARRGGQIELLLAGGLILVSLFSLYNSLPRRRPVPEPMPELMMEHFDAGFEVGNPGIHQDANGEEGAAGSSGSVPQQDEE